jgi:hypothetical protein
VNFAGDRVYMKENRALKIASLRVESGLLQAEERRLCSLIDSASTPAELRAQAQIQLNQTLEKLMDNFAEINRLESDE